VNSLFRGQVVCVAALEGGEIVPGIAQCQWMQARGMVLGGHLGGDFIKSFPKDTCASKVVPLEGTRLDFLLKLLRCIIGETMNSHVVMAKI